MIGAGALLTAAVCSSASTPVFVSPQRGHELLVKDDATVLDARGIRGGAPYVPHSRSIDWFDYRDGTFRTGRLSPDVAAVARALSALGVRNDRVVLVYGAMAEGWGEEGRIWWMLRYLGHDKAFIVDGGIDAWVAAGLPIANATLNRRTDGRFVPKLNPAVRMRAPAIHASAGAGLKVVDVRSKDEFDGSTPYMSPRGGHVPGALHVYWKQFVGNDGRVLEPERVRSMLRARGVEPTATVVTYCTGGVRSAFAMAVLSHAGFERAANYDGSWWDWSARDQLPVE